LKERLRTGVRSKRISVRKGNRVRENGPAVGIVRRGRSAIARARKSRHFGGGGEIGRREERIESDKSYREERRFMVSKEDRDRDRDRDKHTLPSSFFFVFFSLFLFLSFSLSLEWDAFISEPPSLFHFEDRPSPTTPR